VILVLKSFDTGHPALAIPASSWNFALSAPGILALNARCTEVMEKPSPTFSSDVGLGFHLLGGELGLAEDQRQRHGEAGRMRRADQLLRV
jgi:hypothetical protein